MLKIDAQSSSSSRRRFSVASSSAPGATETSLYPSANILHPPHEHQSNPSPSVLVTIVHSPLHVGCFFQPPSTPLKQSSYSEHQTQQQQGCSAFSLASPACSRTFPLRRCDWEGRGGAGAGAALFAAAAAVEGGGGGDSSTEGHVSAEEVPKDERLRYRYETIGSLSEGDIRLVASLSAIDCGARPGYLLISAYNARNSTFGR